MKKINNGALRLKDVGQEVTLYGWVERIRKLGNLVFINLRDRDGITQITLTDKKLVQNLTKESVIKVIGIVQKRFSINTEMLTGAIEVIAKSLEVLAYAKELPFEIENNINIKEDLRIQYRYLDLRSKRMLENLRLKHRLYHYIRNYLTNAEFIEVETPMLSKTTPEGARDFIVPTRHESKNLFFALPQSPQIYKQLLMVSGIERYFQITKVFRDEDARADRQPEFTQLDIEVSFPELSELKLLIESMLKDVLKKMIIKKKITFSKMSYDEAMENYGVDKPDTTYEVLLTDVKKYFKNTSSNIFKTAEAIKLLAIDEKITEQQFKLLEEIANKNKQGRITLVHFKDNEVNGKLGKIIEREVKNIAKDMNVTKKTFIFCASSTNTVNSALGAVRVELNNLFNYSNYDLLNFVWIDGWPLFEYSEQDKKFTSAHHPFTRPTKESEKNFDKEPAKARAVAYDLVLNGFEIAGGSFRIHEPELQRRIFSTLGFSDKEITEQFGFLINSFNYGVPPHGGIAFGLDRLAMLLANEKSIREVIAFPKNSKGYDPLNEAPAPIDESRLTEYNLKYKK